MPFRMRIPQSQVYDHSKFVDRHGRTDAIAFVRQVTGAPHPGIWRAGAKIQSARPGEIPPLMAIATFNEKGFYICDALGCHAAIYLGHDEHLIWVLDQWPLQGSVKRRSIFFDVKDGTERGNDGKTFFVIE